MTEGKCATTGCRNAARWISVPEGNHWGMTAPRRCEACCDAIRYHGMSAGALIDVIQLKSWGKITREYRSVGADNIRRVLAMTERGTALIPWYGPVGSEG